MLKVTTNKVIIRIFMYGRYQFLTKKKSKKTRQNKISLEGRSILDMHKPFSNLSEPFPSQLVLLVAVSFSLLESTIALDTSHCTPT